MGIQVLSNQVLRGLDSEKRIQKILEIVRKGDVVMFEGKLDSDEELALTSKALGNVSGKFSGIEIAYLDDASESQQRMIDRVRNQLLKWIARDRLGVTVVGPSKIIKEIKMDPNKLEILYK